VSYGRMKRCRGGRGTVTLEHEGDGASGSKQSEGLVFAKVFAERDVLKTKKIDRC